VQGQLAVMQPSAPRISSSFPVYFLLRVASVAEMLEPPPQLLYEPPLAKSQASGTAAIVVALEAVQHGHPPR